MRRIEQAAYDIPAAGELLLFIRENYRTVPAFCEAVGLDRPKVERAIKGGYRRMHLDLALDIEHATGGRVKAGRWRRGGKAA
ncbi:MAG TPA: hypothetical protein VGJ84_23590 [Polyangiaceae bacterium]|jgi:hypothetical protein